MDEKAMNELIMELGKNEYEKLRKFLENIVTEIIEEKYKKQEELQEERKTIQNDEEIDLVEYTTNVLHQLGIPAHVRGYKYLRDAIIIAVNDYTVIQQVTKLLYPTIAKKYESTPSRIERAIRHAIELGWTRGNVEKIEKIFAYTVDNEKSRPTNSEFIAMISDQIRLKLKIKN